jgi:hypothetical protein
MFFIHLLPLPARLKRALASTNLAHLWDFWRLVASDAVTVILLAVLALWPAGREKG